MQTLLKRVVGLTAGVIGLVGVVFAVAAVCAIWRSTQRLERDLPGMLSQAAAVLESIDQQSKATVGLLDAARRRVGAIQEPLQELARPTPSGANAATLLETLDAQIGHRLIAAEQLTISMRDSMRSMTTALSLLDSLPFIRARLTSDARRPTQWQAVANSLTDAANQLDQVAQALTTIREGQTISPRQLEQLQEALAGVEAQLTTIRADIESFSDVIRDTRKQLEVIATQALRAIYWTAIVLTVFFVCFGASQISLILQGLRNLKRTAERQETKAATTYPT